MMTKEKFTKMKSNIEKNYITQLQTLNKQFTKENNPYKIGDIIEDNFQRIKIDIIQYGKLLYLDEYPCCVYRGIRLTKKNVPFKTNATDSIHQTNVERKINK